MALVCIVHEIFDFYLASKIIKKASNRPYRVDMTRHTRQLNPNSTHIHTFARIICKAEWMWKTKYLIFWKEKLQNPQFYNLLFSCAGVDFFPISSNIGRCDCKNCLFISEKIVAEERKPGQILTIGDQVDLGWLLGAELNLIMVFTLQNLTTGDCLVNRGSLYQYCHYVQMPIK